MSSKKNITVEKKRERFSKSITTEQTAQPSAKRLRDRSSKQNSTDAEEKQVNKSRQKKLDGYSVDSWEWKQRDIEKKFWYKKS
jgi:hypothetical protein